MEFFMTFTPVLLALKPLSYYHQRATPVNVFPSTKIQGPLTQPQRLATMPQMNGRGLWWSASIAAAFGVAVTAWHLSLQPVAPPPVTTVAANQALPMRPRMRVAEHRDTIASSPYGTAPVGTLLAALTEARGGTEAQMLFQALALRKTDALPAVKERLRTGEMFEKFILTKFLRYCPWPETLPELVALARDKTQYWMPRQGALYALGALGDKTAGPAVAEILREPDCPTGVQLAAISALARLHCRDEINAIRPFTQNADIHLRLYAARALAEFSEPVDEAFLLASLEDKDYVVRQEACGALGAAGITGKLAWLAGNDPHEAVRAAAAQAVLEHGLRGQPADTKMAILRDALPQADRLTTTWILRTMLAQGGAPGRALVEELAQHDDRLGERSRAYLTLVAGK
jgi:HEAT repeat protein